MALSFVVMQTLQRSAAASNGFLVCKVLFTAEGFGARARILLSGQAKRLFIKSGGAGGGFYRCVCLEQSRRAFQHNDGHT